MANDKTTEPIVSTSNKGGKVGGGVGRKRSRGGGKRRLQKQQQQAQQQQQQPQQQKQSQQQEQQQSQQHQKQKQNQKQQPQPQPKPPKLPPAPSQKSAMPLQMQKDLLCNFATKDNGNTNCQPQLHQEAQNSEGRKIIYYTNRAKLAAQAELLAEVAPFREPHVAGMEQ